MVWGDPFSLQYVKILHDDDGYRNDDQVIGWYEGYQKRKARKAQIKEELMPIAWHPSCWRDWCVSEDEKKLLSIHQDGGIGVSPNTRKNRKIKQVVDFDYLIC